MSSRFPASDEPDTPKAEDPTGARPKDRPQGPDSLAQMFEAKLSLAPPDLSHRPPPPLPIYSRPPPPIPMPSSTAMSLPMLNRPPPTVAISQMISADPFFELYTKVFSDFASSRSPGLSDGSWSLATSGSPTLFNDPFLRGEGPLEAGDPRFRELFLPMQMQTQRPGFDSQPKPYVPRNLRQKPRFNYCVFCKNNGEDERFYLSHTLKDDFGAITCPILFSYTCETCGATGRVAHTRRYCPSGRDQSQGELVPITTLKTMRPSIGSHRGARNEPPTGQAEARMPTSQPQFWDRRQQKRATLGPNAAWTGITAPPAITPMAGELINREMRQAKEANPSKPSPV